MYRWKIQYSEFYTDQFSDKGLIDKTKAIEEFQQFAWDKEIDGIKGIKTSRQPTKPSLCMYSRSS